MAFTVTAVNNQFPGVALYVLVLTGATEAGGNNAAAVGTSVLSTSFTPTFTNSRLAVSTVNMANQTNLTLAANETTDSGAFTDGVSNWAANLAHYTGTVTSGTPVTVGATAPTGGLSGYAVYEIRASGGATPAIDASSAGNNSTTNTAVTGSFTPPAGAVLAAMVATNGTGSGGTVTITDTSGLGLTWTPRASASGAWVYTTTMPGGGGGGAPGGPQQLPAWPAPMAGVFGPGAPFTGPGVTLDQPVTITATASLAGAGAVNAQVYPFLTGIAGTGTAQYFTDQAGQPYLLRWDTVWGLIDRAGVSGGATTWQSDIDGYCAARAGQGFNGFLSSPVMTSVTADYPLNGNTWDGVAPFTSPGVLNSTFWARVDYLLNSAQAAGLTVVLNVMFYYAIDTSGACLNGWTTTQLTTYGTALGTRYKNQPNLVWEFGDDDYGVTYDAKFDACLAGIRGAGDTHLVSYEARWESSSRHSIDHSTDYPWGIANAQFNWVYGYNAAYDGVEAAYTESAPLLVCHMDGWYDNNRALSGESTALFMRKLTWWILSSGSRGYQYGNQELRHWPSGALANSLYSGGSLHQDAAALNTILDTFASFTGWHQLVPDTSSALVTAGRGTHVTAYAPGGIPMYTGGNGYVSASVTASKSLAVIYLPAATTITIDQTKIASGAGTYTATWVDPVTGATSSATPGTTYNSTAKGNNSAGDPDWALVLQVIPVTTATANLAGAGAVAAKATVIAPASLAAAGAVAAKATVIAPAALAGAGAVNATGTVPGPVFNDFEGGSNGTAVTTSNAGGTGDTQFDAVNLTAIAFDNAHAAHGSLAAKQTVSNNAAYLRWTTSMGTQSQVWFRLYLYFTAIPSFSGTVWQASNAGGICAGLSVNGAGKLSVYDGAGPTNITTSTAVIPLNAWFRVEGFIVFSATVGQTEVKLFTTMDGATAAETDTSAATQNTRGPATTYDFGAGFQTSPAVYWFDDVGLSSTGYLGPAAVPPGTATLAAAGSVAAVATVIAPAAAAGAGAVTATAAQGAPGTLAGAGALAALVTQKAPAAAAGLGALAGLAAEAVTAPLAGAGTVAALVTELAPGTLAGAGTLAALATEPATGTLAGAGTLAALVTEPGAATLAGAGTVTANSGAGATGTAALAGAGAVSAAATVAAPAVLTGAGAVTATAAQGAPGTLAGAGALAAVAAQGVTAVTAGLGAVTALATEQATAQLAAAGSITDVVTQAVTASPAGAGAVAASPAGAGNTAALAAAGSLTNVVTQAVTAAVAGAGVITAGATQAATANLAGAGSVAGVVTEAAAASPAAAGSLSAVGSSAGAATASHAGAGAVAGVVTQAVTASAAAAGAVAATVTLRGAAALTAAGALSANGQITGTANLAGAGGLTARAVQAATAAPAAAGTLAAVAAQRAAAALPGAGSVTAASGIQLAFTVGTLTATDRPTGVLTATASPAGAGGVLTATDQRTGGPG